MGIVDIVKHELVDSYPVLWEKEGMPHLFIAFQFFQVNLSLNFNSPL